MQDSCETIQEIAHTILIEQIQNDKTSNGVPEKTVFVLGSKGVVSLYFFLKLDKRF